MCTLSAFYRFNRLGAGVSRTFCMAQKLPALNNKIIVTKITSNFDEAAVLHTEDLATQLKEDEVLVKNKFVGINASDINYSAGRYDHNVTVPFDCGFEGHGEVVHTGSSCQQFLSKNVLYMKFGAFAQYTVVPSSHLLQVPQLNAEYLPFMVSGLTAMIALDKAGRVKSGETVLVTAAAGGTGQFAVQYAKSLGCHVIGTCSSAEKVAMLKSLGCDRVVNYNEEKLGKVLRLEYPKGIDVIYESVGGSTYDTCVVNLAKHGRLIVIGFITGYENEAGFAPNKTAAGLPARLLMNSASVNGFFLSHFAPFFAEYLKKLLTMYNEGRLRSIIDDGRNTSGGKFVGLDSVFRAVKHLYSKKSVGKIVVQVDPEPKL